MNAMKRLFCCAIIGAVVLLTSDCRAAEPAQYDVVVYGATAGGVTAAVQAARMDKRVLLISPSQRVGGLTSGGLGATDIGNKSAIGGLSREFYRRVQKHYAEPSAWRQQPKAAYRSRRQTPNDDAMWTFEPHVAEQILREMLAETTATLLLNERLELDGGVTMSEGVIQSIMMESGKRFAGKVFIDASYEGDLLAKAGVSYHVGREANAKYDETLNGVQTRNAIHHQFQAGVDPYRIAGDPSSGLLPGVHAGPPGEEGAGDHRVQAYNLRLCVTDAVENQLPFEKPADYDPQQFELLLRNFEAGETRIPWSPTPMPNRKTDTNNNYGFSTDFIGESYQWPEADYATRARIYTKHLRYMQGLMWTLANHPRVPAAIRAEVSRWGNCQDEFTENGGWSPQLYVREARRMVSEYVMTQHHCVGREVAEDSVGLAAYTMDSHNVQRYVDAQGQVRNEGDVQVGGFSPYPIAYRALRPTRQECRNLLAPVALSASHIAYGSIRMEPVFMVLGQSAATAACLAIDQQSDVQDVDIAMLQSRLQADGQVLAWKGPKRAPAQRIDARDLDGVVVDLSVEDAPGWTSSSSAGKFVGAYYLHDGNEAKGRLEAEFKIVAPKEGTYELRLAYSPHGNRATNAVFQVVQRDSVAKVTINQRQKPPLDDLFFPLATIQAQQGETIKVQVNNADTDGYVIIDAIQLAPKPR